MNNQNQKQLSFDIEDKIRIQKQLKSKIIIQKLTNEFYLERDRLKAKFKLAIEKQNLNIAISKTKNSNSKSILNKTSKIQKNHYELLMQKLIKFYKVKLKNELQELNNKLERK